MYKCQHSDSFSRLFNEILCMNSNIFKKFVEKIYERISHTWKNYQINVVPKSARNLNKIIVEGKDKIKKCDKNNMIYMV